MSNSSGGDGTRRALGPPLARSEAETRAEQLRVVADPIRLQILSVLLSHPGGEVRVADLVRRSEVGASTVSYHLGLLRDAGLVVRERRAGSVYYRPSHQAVAHFAGLLSPIDNDREDATWPERFPAVPALEAAMAGTHGQLERIAEQLAAQFEGVFSRETVGRYVHESYEMLAARSRIRRFLPSLAANFAGERLGALAKAEGLLASPVPEVLFVCVKNSGRSAMAAAMLTQRMGSRVRVRSAGSMPAAAVDERVVVAMDEIGVFLGGTYPKPLTDEVVRASDVVITMGCGDACPVYPGKRYMDWPVGDPSGKSLVEVRKIRDHLERHVRDLALGLGHR